MGKIIVIEDNLVYRKYVCNLLEREGIPTETGSTLASARKLLLKAEGDDMVLTDLRLPDGDGIALLKWMRANGKMHSLVIMTDYAEVHTAVESIKLGSEDYLPKKLLPEKLLPLVREIRRKRACAGTSPMPIFKRTSESFLNIKKRIRLVAATNMSVLIWGENGTGKEHIAQRIHAKSKRADKPFVAVDCGSLSVALAASAFFGHVKGAFTGADSNKTGYFQEAEGGTLFLDEIGNLPYEMQQMLLRAIQERKYRPVGAKEERTANVRIVTATNEDLQQAVAEKRFRQDLLYRLQDFQITVPPLRDCKEDILPLADFFRIQGNKELEKNVTGFDAGARKALLTYMWPGNVREMKQKILTAVLLAEGSTISEEELELGYEPNNPPACFSLKDEGQEKERIMQALKQADGNRTIAAKLLGIGRTTLYSKMKNYGLE